MKENQKNKRIYKDRRNIKRGRKILVSTICSRRKRRDRGLLPAIERYRSRRIKKLFRMAKEGGLHFAILSGKFGLLAPGDPIPYYDRLLKEGDISPLSDRVAALLKKKSAQKIIFLVPDPEDDPAVSPYIECMIRACRQAGGSLQVKYVPPYPDSLP